MGGTARRPLTVDISSSRLMPSAAAACSLCGSDPGRSRIATATSRMRLTTSVWACRLLAVYLEQPGDTGRTDFRAPPKRTDRAVLEPAIVGESLVDLQRPLPLPDSDRGPAGGLAVGWEAGRGLKGFRR